MIEKQYRGGSRGVQRVPLFASDSLEVLIAYQCWIT